MSSLQQRSSYWWYQKATSESKMLSEFLNCMDTVSELKIMSVSNWQSSNCMERYIRKQEALLLTSIQGLVLGAFAKHNQYRLMLHMKYHGQALSCTCNTQIQRVFMWDQVGRGKTPTRNLDYTALCQDYSISLHSWTCDKIRRKTDFLVC